MGFSADRSLFFLRPRHFQEGVLHADNAREKKVAEEVSCYDIALDRIANCNYMLSKNFRIIIRLVFRKDQL